jgi:hypothetical protein
VRSSTAPAKPTISSSIGSVRSKASRDSIRPHVIFRAQFQSVDEPRNLVALTALDDGMEQRDYAIGLRNSQFEL